MLQQLWTYDKFGTHGRNTFPVSIYGELLLFEIACFKDSGSFLYVEKNNTNTISIDKNVHYFELENDVVKL